MKKRYELFMFPANVPGPRPEHSKGTFDTFKEVEDALLNVPNETAVMKAVVIDFQRSEKLEAEVHWETVVSWKK